MLRYVKNGMLLLSVAYIVIGMLLLIMQIGRAHV